jgi:hypothetical protein
VLLWPGSSSGQAPAPPLQVKGMADGWQEIQSLKFIVMQSS